MTTAPASTIRHDASEESYPWEVLDADGDVLDCFGTEAEALAYVAAESAEDEAAELRGLIAEKMEDMDADALKALAAFLNL